MPKLSSVAGLAGPILSADRAALMGRLVPDLYAERRRRFAAALAAVLTAPSAPADALGPHHHVPEAPCPH
jgi:hypothetical protein